VIENNSISVMTTCKLSSNLQSWCISIYYVWTKTTRKWPL